MNPATAPDLTVVYISSALGALAAYVYYGFALMAIFRKAGLKAWVAWVPPLNLWRLLQLGGQKGWWIVVAFVPAVGTILYLVFLIIAGIKIQAAFGKPGVFYLLAIFLTPVWYGILAWDSSTWIRRDGGDATRPPLSLLKPDDRRLSSSFSG